MNPFDLSASDLMIWGLVLHLIADWPLQNDWMAKGKAAFPSWPNFVHGLIHALLLSVVFGPIIGGALGVTHALIDTRVPVVWWSKRIGQTQPSGQQASSWAGYLDQRPVDVVDIGMEVRFWTDQVFHISMIAIAAIGVSL